MVYQVCLGIGRQRKLKEGLRGPRPEVDETESFQDSGALAGTLWTNDPCLVPQHPLQTPCHYKIPEVEHGKWLWLNFPLNL